MKKYDGVSLVELMIVSVMMTFIVSAAVNMYLRFRSNNIMIIAINSTRATAIKIIEKFKYDLTRAGFVGCRKLTDDFINSYQRFSITPTNFIEISRDDLVARYMGNFTYLRDPMVKGEQSLVLYGNIIFNVDDIIVIADCEHGEINKVISAYSRYGKQLITLAQPLRHQYDDNALIGHYIENHYYIKNKVLYLSHTSGSINAFAKSISQLEFNFLPKDKDRTRSAITVKLQLDNLHVKRPWYAYFNIND